MLKGFRNNQMIANPGKLEYILFGKQKHLKIEIERFQLESAKSVKPLGIAIYQNVILQTHASSICKTAKAKVKSLSRI